MAFQQTLADLIALADAHVQKHRFGVREAMLAKVIAAGETDNVMTTLGDIIIGGASGAATRLAKGTSGLPLVAGASTLSYAALTNAGIDAAAAIALSKLASYTTTTDGVDKLERLAIATYDFSVNGGAISTISLGVTIPSNAVVTSITTEVVTAPTSGGSTGTIKLVLPTDGDLTATLTADGTAAHLNTFSSTVPKKTTANRLLSATIATSALTAGKLRYMVRYVQSI